MNRRVVIGILILSLVVGWSWSASSVRTKIRVTGCTHVLPIRPPTSAATEGAVSTVPITSIAWPVSRGRRPHRPPLLRHPPRCLPSPQVLAA
jgi:hypothetical protein